MKLLCDFVANAIYGLRVFAFTLCTTTIAVYGLKELYYQLEYWYLVS